MLRSVSSVFLVQCRHITYRRTSVLQQEADDAALLRAIALSLQSYNSTVTGLSREEADMSRALEESLRDTTCGSGERDPVLDDLSLLDSVTVTKDIWGQEEEDMFKAMGAGQVGKNYTTLLGVGSKKKTGKLSTFCG
jgi:hypothetical protein